MEYNAKAEVEDKVIYQTKYIISLKIKQNIKTILILSHLYLDLLGPFSWLKNNKIVLACKSLCNWTLPSFLTYAHHIIYTTIAAFLLVFGLKILILL